MIIFKRKHLSIKWGIFAGILVFLAILLLLLFLLQTVYLDDIYSNFIRTFTNGQRKMEAVLLRSSQVISSVIPLNCLPRMENCPRSQPVTETRRVNLLKMRILEMESFRSDTTERDCTGKHGERKNFDNQQYTISYNCKRTPHTSKCHRADDPSGTNISTFWFCLKVSDE